MAAGFRSPSFVLGYGAPPASSGFISPLPVFISASSSTTAGLPRSPIPLFMGVRVSTGAGYLSALPLFYGAQISATPEVTAKYVKRILNFGFTGKRI